MSEREVKNIVASVLARLRNYAKSTNAPFQQVLQQYAIERFLYRISKSKHAESVVLKGALLLKTIGIPTARPTMDIDMLRQGNADQATLITNSDLMGFTTALIDAVWLGDPRVGEVKELSNDT